MAEIQTIKNIDKIFADVAERHYQIHSYGWGANWEISTTEEIYPLLWVQPTDGELIKSDANNRYTSKNFTFNVKVLDLVKKDESNERDIESDTYEILTDICNEFNDHPFYQNSNMLLEGDITVEPLDEFGDDETTGWEATMTVRMVNRTSFCGLPMRDIVGFSFTGPFPTNAVTITDANATPSTFELFPSASYTCLTPSASTYTITNSGATFSTGITGDYQLNNITHIDSDGSPIDLPGQVGFTATTCTGTSTVFSGITYDRPLVTGQDTSYRTGDDASQLASGTYEYTAPTSPLNYAQIDKDAIDPYRTLLHNNIFANKNRFTDTGGTQTYADDYVIDHLTGLGWYRISQPTSSWNDAIDNTLSSTQNGFSDWRLPNQSEYYSVLDRENGTIWWNYSPFNISNSTRKWSSTTDSNTTTSALIFQSRTFVTRGKVQTDPIHYLVRNHYTGSTVSSTSILYDRPQLTGQETTYETGDDGWHLSAGTYDYTPPVNIVSVARLNNNAVSPFTTLVDNNAFGNKDRFTDSGGTQTYTGNLVIDHLTGLMYYRVLQSGGNWATQVSNANSSTQGGFSDWRMGNSSEVESIADRELTSTLNYAPFSTTLPNFVRTSTTLRATTTSAYRLSATGTLGAGAKTNSTNTNYIIRNHYN